MQGVANFEVSNGERVLINESLTRGECLVGVVGHAEVGFTSLFEGVVGVVLVVTAVLDVGAGARDGDGDEGVCGDDFSVGDVVGGGDDGGGGVEEVGDEGRGVVGWWGGLEGEVGLACGDAVADVAECGFGLEVVAG